MWLKGFAIVVAGVLSFWLAKLTNLAAILPVEITWGIFTMAGVLLFCTYVQVALNIPWTGNYVPVRFFGPNEEVVFALSLLLCGVSVTLGAWLIPQDAWILNALVAIKTFLLADQMFTRLYNKYCKPKVSVPIQYIRFLS